MKHPGILGPSQMLTTCLIHHVHILTFPSEAVGTCLPTCR